MNFMGVNNNTKKFDVFILKILFALIIALRLITRTQTSKLEIVMTYISYGVIAVFIGAFMVRCLIDMHRKETKFDKWFYIVVGIFAVFIALFGIVLCNPQLFKFILKNSVNYVAFFLIAIGGSYTFCKYGSFQELINIFYFVSTVFLLYLFIRFFDGVGIFSNITTLFSRANRERNFWGMQHPNTAGNVFLMHTILSYFFVLNSFKDKNNKKAVAGIIMWCVTLFMLITCASRAAILSVAVFFGTLLFFNLFNKANKKFRKKIVILLCCAPILVFSLMIALNISITKILIDSNRYWNFVVNIPTVIDKGKVLSGLGFVNNGDFVGDELRGMYGTTNTDNFFLYIFVATGVLGLIIMVAFLSFVYFSVVKKANKTKEFNYIIAIITTTLFYGLFECSVLEPSFMTSLLSFCIYFYFIILDKQNIVEKQV